LNSHTNGLLFLTPYASKYRAMRLVITPHRPMRKALVALALLAGVGLALSVAMDYGHWKSIAQAMVSTGEKRSLLDEVVALRRENRTLRHDGVRLRRAAEIGAHERRKLHEQLVLMQSRGARLQSEVDFYSDVVGATEIDKRPRVKGIHLTALPGDGRFRYKLVLTHVSQNDRVVEGSLSLNVLGDLHGQRKTLPYADIIESGPNVLDFKFKHFHLFEGTLKIPTGFIPQQVNISVRDKAKRKKREPQSFDWPSVVE
jgi:hypothetical protein